MSTIRSWSRNHPVEPFVLFAVVFTLALAAFVTSPTTRSQEQMPEKYKLALYTAPTNSTGATRSNETPVGGRRLKPVGLAPSNDSGQPPWTDKFARRDDGYGYCPAFSHYHATRKELEAAGFMVFAEDGVMLDGKCHKDDNTDAPIGERAKLPKPVFHPDPRYLWM